MHLSAGRPTAALLAYDALAPELARLPAGHPNLALVDSARAYALAASGRPALAYEALVATKVGGLVRQQPGVLYAKGLARGCCALRTLGLGVGWNAPEVWLLGATEGSCIRWITG